MITKFKLFEDRYDKDKENSEEIPDLQYVDFSKIEEHLKNVLSKFSIKSINGEEMIKDGRLRIEYKEDVSFIYKMNFVYSDAEWLYSDIGKHNWGQYYISSSDYGIEFHIKIENKKTYLKNPLVKYDWRRRRYDNTFYSNKKYDCVDVGGGCFDYRGIDKAKVVINNLIKFTEERVEPIRINKETEKFNI